MKNEISESADGKLYIVDEIEKIDLYDLEGTFESACETLLASQAAAKKSGKYYSIYLDVSRSHEGDGDMDLRVMGRREVTEKEREEYIAYQCQLKQYQEAEYFRLGKLLGKN